MAFKNSSQRKAVMARLRSNVVSTPGFRRIRVTKDTTKDEANRFLKTNKEASSVLVASLKKSEDFKELDKKDQDKLLSKARDIATAKNRKKLREKIEVFKTFQLGAGLSGSVVLAGAATGVSIINPVLLSLIASGIIVDSQRRKIKIRRELRSL